MRSPAGDDIDQTNRECQQVIVGGVIVCGILGVILIGIVIWGVSSMPTEEEEKVKLSSELTACYKNAKAAYAADDAIDKKLVKSGKGGYCLRSSYHGRCRTWFAGARPRMQVLNSLMKDLDSNNLDELRNVHYRCLNFSKYLKL